MSYDLSRDFFPDMIVRYARVLTQAISQEKGRDMAQAVPVQLEELPLLLTMRHVQEITGLSKPMVYGLPHIQGFPVVRFGRTLRVPREAFFRWLEQQAGVQE